MAIALFKGMKSISINGVKELIASSDPLSDEAIRFLLNYQEEDTLVDFKLSFDNDDREWLEITKDILAFSNTNGGYLVFGIKDGSFEKIGLETHVVRVISDANNIIQKLNRNIEPHIQLIRCKSYNYRDKDFVVIFIPPSLDKTHIISRSALFKFPSGKEKTILHIGTTYVRRSAGNHMMDSRDLDDVVNRRISYFKDSLLDKIARVVEAPQKSEVFIVTEDREAGEHVKFIVEDAPDAIPVKGMSFSVSPETIEQEIMGWMAMTSHDEEALPAPAITWKWYKERKSLQLTNDQKIEAAKYCLLTNAPVFYWLRGCESNSIKSMLLDVLSRYLNASNAGDIISVGAFLGNKFYKQLFKRIGNYSERIAPARRSVPTAGPRQLFRADSVPIKSDINDLENELDKISENAGECRNHEPPLQSRWRAQTLDCYLYSQDDQYVKRKA